MDPLAPFSPKTRGWFERAFAGPTPAQAAGWPAIASGGHVLIQAPTGSGKTLAAFLYGIDRLDRAPGQGLRLLYVSPLKALNYDVERNLRGPLAGLQSELRVGVRTGDTSQKERRELVKEPPDILITTPESLFLMLTSQARETLRAIETVIVDEVHAVAGTKRGVHLAVSLERLDALLEQPAQRIGLSATQRPLEEIGRFVSGDRPIQLVDAGTRKDLDLEVVVPLDDMREPGEGGSIWPSIYPGLLELVKQHRSTIVFVNNRRLAERLAVRLNELAEEEIARAHHGSLAREQRVLIEEDLKAGRIPCLVATSSLELGIDMGAVDLVIQVESPKSVARGLQRVGRAGHELGSTSKGRIFPKFRADLLESAVVARAMRGGEIEETKIPRNPLDVLAQQIVAIVAEEEIEVSELHRLVRGAYPVLRPLPHPARERARHARRPLSLRRVRRAAAADRLGPHRRRHPRPHRRAPARGHERGHDPRPRPLRRPPRRRRRPRRRARRGDGLRGAAGADVHARRLDVADRGDHARPRARLARARRARRRPVLEGRRRRPPVRAGREDRPRLARARRALRREGARAPARRVPPRPARGPEPAHLPARAGGRDRRRPLRPRRSSSSASATRSATGASAS